MHHAETQKSEIERAFLRRRRNQLVLAAALVPNVAAVLLYQRHLVSTIFGMSAQVAGPIFLVLAVGGLLFSLWNWRCPACSNYLGRAINPRHCPNCGVRLRG